MTDVDHTYFEQPKDKLDPNISNDPAYRRSVLIDALLALSDNEKAISKFKWFFGYWFDKYRTIDEGCGTKGCAIGLATMLWPEHKDKFVTGLGICSLPNVKFVGEFFGMNSKQMERCFWNTYDTYSTSVTPKMVANRLKEII